MITNSTSEYRGSSRRDPTVSISVLGTERFEPEGRSVVGLEVDVIVQTMTKAS